MIYKYIKYREIPFIPFGRLVRFDRTAVDKWAEKKTVRGYRQSFRPLELQQGSDAPSLPPSIENL